MSRHERTWALTMLMLVLLCGRTYTQFADGPNDIHFNQSIGLINIPTANILKHGDLRFSLNAGIISLGLFDFFEMGIMAFNSNDKFYYGNRMEMKWADETWFSPAIAFGGESFTENPQLKGTKYYNSCYMVTSKGLGDFGIVHMGIGNGRFVGTGEVSSKLNGFFCGIEKTFLADTPYPFTFKLEEDGKDVNFGIMFRLVPGINITYTASKLDNLLYNHPAPNNDAEYMIGFNVDATLPPIPRKKENND